MATGRTGTDSPAALFGPVSLVLGVAATAAALGIDYVGLAVPLLAGLLALTFATLGLFQHASRPLCLLGLAGGAVGVVTALGTVASFSG